MWFLTLFCLVIAVKVTSDENVRVDSRIIRGQEATIEEHPYQVSFIVKSYYSYFCGGFIVNENYILTAAHCIQYAVPSNVTLRVGSSYRNNGTIIPIAELKFHPNYGKNVQFDNDIGYMKTVKPIQFTDTIQAIGLPPKNRVVGGNVTVSGWGVTQVGAQGGFELLSDRLMHVDLPVVEVNDCKIIYNLTINMWCGGDFYYGGPSTCQGDSGGAAVQNGMAVGIVSFGKICGAKFQPIVFTNTAAPEIRDFITKNTGL